MKNSILMIGKKWYLTLYNFYMSSAFDLLRKGEVTETSTSFMT